VNDTSYKLVLFVLVGLAGVSAFFLGRHPARNGFLLFIVTLGLGFRTLPVTNSLRIHPAEIALLLVLACVFAKRPEKSVGRKDGQLPWWLWSLLPFMALAWLPRSDNPIPWDQQMAECVNVALAVPVFLAARAVLTNRDAWRLAVVTLYAVGTYVALFGVVEYVFPGVKNLLPGFVSSPEGTESDGGFVRASFSFYGNPDGIFLSMLSLPFGLAIWRWWPSVAARAAVAAAALVQMSGVYVSGYRSQWLMLGAMLLVLLLKSRRFWLACLLIGLAVASFQLLPQGTQGRLDSLEKILEGKPDDSSGLKREHRIEEAFYSTLRNPFGGGWASAGWVHSDFLQVSVNLGLAAGILLLCGYLYTLFRLGMRLGFPPLSPEQSALALALFLSFLVAGQLLAVQGVEFQSFTVLPLWLVWAMTEVWLVQTAPAAARGRGKAVGRTAVRVVRFPRAKSLGVAPQPQ
jgi:hypothetical protein